MRWPKMVQPLGDTRRRDGTPISMATIGYYGHHNYYARPYAPYVLHYPVPLYGYMGGVGSYWDYYRTDWPGRGNDEESTR